MKIKLLAGFAPVIMAMLLLGCAGKSTELLTEDFIKMNNDQLLEYFYRLNDEIEKQEKQTGPSFGVGVGGFGLGPGRGGIGGGVGVGTGGNAYTADDLRKRRIDVRMELKRRNINP